MNSTQRTAKRGQALTWQIPLCDIYVGLNQKKGCVPLSAGCAYTPWPRLCCLQPSRPGNQREQCTSTHHFRLVRTLQRGVQSGCGEEHANKCVCVCVCVHACTHACIYTCVCMCLCVYVIIHAHTHTCAYVIIHTHTHTHVRT